MLLSWEVEQGIKTTGATTTGVSKEAFQEGTRTSIGAILSSELTEDRGRREKIIALGKKKTPTFTLGRRPRSPRSANRPYTTAPGIRGKKLTRESAKNWGCRMDTHEYPVITEGSLRPHPLLSLY